MRVALTKMHGARNDFVILDRRASPVAPLDSFARWVCDRRTGIGADGLIAIETSSRQGFAMRTINADGTEAEMCGNGIRCAARWLDESGEGDRIDFETAAGEVRTHVVSRSPEYLVRVTVPMGGVRAHAIEFLDDAFFVDLGNPHVVLFRDDVEDVDLEVLAPSLQTHSSFTEGTNVHVAAIEGDDLRMRHWERGVGLTLACGTGAVAAATAAIASGRVSSPVITFVPGGRLVVEWDGESVATLTGPAVRVFDTEVQV